MQVERFDDVFEIRRATKADLRQRASVRLHDILDTLDPRVHWVAIQRETVRDRVDSHVSWDASEAESCEHPADVIGLKNRTDLGDRSLVLVLSAKEMKGVRLRRIAVRSSVVNRQS